MRNYYSVLKVRRDASPEQIKQAYARMQGAKLSAEEKMILDEAFLVLSDPALRRTHDLFLDRMAKAAAGEEPTHNGRLLTLPEVVRLEEQQNSIRRKESMEQVVSLSASQKFATVIYFLMVWVPLILAIATKKWILLATYVLLPLYASIPSWIMRRRVKPGV